MTRICTSGEWSHLPDGRHYPVKKIIACPDCYKLHFDKPYAQIHDEHECHYCGKKWKPFPYHTVGVDPQDPSVPLWVVEKELRAYGFDVKRLRAYGEYLARRVSILRAEKKSEKTKSSR